MEVINDLIRELMYQQRKTISDICDGTGLSLITVKNIVVYNIMPNTKDADLILRCLGESLDEILSLY